MKHGDKIKADMLDAGLKIMRRGEPVSVRAVGRALGMTHQSVLYHFTNSSRFADAVAVEAVRIGDPDIVPRLITAKHPAVADMPGADRDRYLAHC